MASHSIIRQQAYASTVRAAVSMSQYYNSKRQTNVKGFAVGDCVSVAVPKLDQLGTDALRLPCVVCQVHAGSITSKYSLSTPFGLLPTRFSAGDLQEYTGTDSS